MYFNPPTPRGGGTINRKGVGDDAFISIHPPRGGVGLLILVGCVHGTDFNPPTPRGGWDLENYREIAGDDIFQSTHPAGGWDITSLSYTS